MSQGLPIQLPRVDSCFTLASQVEHQLWLGSDLPESRGKFQRVGARWWYHPKPPVALARPWPGTHNCCLGRESISVCPELPVISGFCDPGSSRAGRDVFVSMVTAELAVSPDRSQETQAKDLHKLLLVGKKHCCEQSVPFSYYCFSSPS